MVDCVTQCDGCLGGNPVYGYAWGSVVRQSNLSDYPYIAAEGICKTNDDSDERAPLVTNFEAVDENSSDQLIAAIRINPVAVAIEADQLVFENY